MTLSHPCINGEPLSFPAPNLRLPSKRNHLCFFLRLKMGAQKGELESRGRTKIDSSDTVTTKAATVEAAE
jgi:hypothetical protein